LIPVLSFCRTAAAVSSQEVSIPKIVLKLFMSVFYIGEKYKSNRV
jgi:hypothetical protein